LITPAKIEEWLREVEERPESAQAIIRQIAIRLKDLDDQNEALKSENIALKMGEKVEAYERRIANLEYQLEILKRQTTQTTIEEISKAPNLLIYDGQGRVFRLELETLSPEAVIANIVVETSLTNDPIHLLVVDSREELLFVFDSGRAVNMPVNDIPFVGQEELEWEQAFLQEPQGLEMLAMIVPISRMALFEYGVQTSRRGFVKKMGESFLESCIANQNVGSGVLAASDKTCSLELCNGNDVLVLVSKNGYLLCMQVDQLSSTISETMRLNIDDHVVSALVPGGEGSILVLTNNGKAFHRDVDWLEPANSLKTQGRSILSQSRREAGTRIVAAVAASDEDWGLALLSDGRVVAHKMSTIFGPGALGGLRAGIEVLSFCTFPWKNEPVASSQSGG
jgi:DNA gyrase/topoisomerase IV subunit A